MSDDSKEFGKKAATRAAPFDALLLEFSDYLHNSMGTLGHMCMSTFNLALIYRVSLYVPTASFI